MLFEKGKVIVARLCLGRLILLIGYNRIQQNDKSAKGVAVGKVERKRRGFPEYLVLYLRVGAQRLQLPGEQ